MSVLASRVRPRSRAAEDRPALTWRLPIDVEAVLTPLDLTKRRLLDFVREGGTPAELEAAIDWALEHHARTTPEATAADFAALTAYAEGLRAMAAAGAGR
jgi:hypothetical protein